MGFMSWVCVCQLKDLDLLGNNLTEENCAFLQVHCPSLGCVQNRLPEPVGGTAASPDPAVWGLGGYVQLLAVHAPQALAGRILYICVYSRGHKISLW